MSTARAYYNEIDSYAAQWLRNLISAGHIAPGDVDERSIEDVRPDDLKGYTQCHFFAGIGVWSLALRRAGWSDDRPIWTGSCPCQPFSAAGKGGGFDDERHLWPHFHYLIEQCGPPVVLGEQVASKDGLAWLDLVQADMEGTGYAFGAVDTCAAGFGAPHIRQRLWWIGERLEHAESDGRQQWRPEPGRWGATGGCGNGRLGDDDDARLEGQRSGHQAESGRVGAVRPVTETGELGGLGHSDGERTGRVGGSLHSPVNRKDGQHSADYADASSAFGGLADRNDNGREEGLRRGSVWPERDAEHGDAPIGLADPNSGRRTTIAGSVGGVREGQDGAWSDRVSADGSTGPTNGFWRDADWLHCRDAKWRPVEPGTFPLAHGAPARVGRLRAYGNAIVADAAQAFIEAYLGALDDRFRLTEVSRLSPAEDVFS